MTEWNTTAVVGAGVELYFGYPDEAAYASAVQRLVKDGVAGHIAAQEPTLWGPDAESEASKRLSWVGLAASSRPLVDPITILRDRLAREGVDHVVLCGMGGSSLAPEVICATSGKALTVLDSSQPDYVASALANRLDETVVVVSSKSGSTVETDSQRRAYEAAFEAAGIDATQRIVVVTDPGSPLDEQSRKDGYTVFNADPDVGGRYSALTAFGLVPSGLAGVDIAALLDQAAAIGPALTADSTDNPGLRLGALLGVAANTGSDKVVLADLRSGIVGFGDWAEQLIAESTGKQGKGILPVVVSDVTAPNFDPNTPDCSLVTIGDLCTDVRPSSGWGASVAGPLGAQILLWEYAVAVAGRVIGINPFDQPDVESAKAAARGLLDAGSNVSEPAFVDGPIAVHATDGLLPADVDSVAAALDALLGHLDPERGYLAVMAYLDRASDAPLAKVRSALARRTRRPTTFGWGPRFLHSTGQYHKGGPPTGVYLQVTTRPQHDLGVPGRPFTFGEFIAAQATGDAQVLAEHGRPVLRLHLADHDAGLATLMEALG
ncbi:MAG: glucose-6-phosphate isomerase [Nocardioidaceae bacterium]